VLGRHANSSRELRTYRSRCGIEVTNSELAAVRVPTLAIVGTADSQMDGVKELRGIMPSFKLVIVNGATHSGPRGVLTRAEFVDAVREFLAAHKQTR
jgi:pimeloyl-ACP methyl ester carboxylesterase